MTRPTLSRRATLALAGAAAAATLGPRAALAVATADAERFVADLIAELDALVNSGGTLQEQAARFRALFARASASEAVARFIMGRAWREMSAAQREGLHDAMLDHVGRVYADLLQDYQGQSIEITGVQDFGDKGVVVTSVARGAGVENTAVDWLISDREGPVQLIDLTIEGVSLLRTQRQEYGALLDARGGDVDRLIADLKSGAAG